MGHRKDVPAINQTTGMTAHKIGELSLGLQCWRHPLCHRVTPPFLLFGSESNGCPTSHSALPPLCFSPSLRAWTLLWTVSRVSYWCNWKCFVIAFSQILMDAKLNEVWILVIRVSLCEIYHQRLKRLQGTIKAPLPSTSQWTVHYYSLKQKAFIMSSFPCEKKTTKLYIHVFDDCWKMKTVQLPSFLR